MDRGSDSVITPSEATLSPQSLMRTAVWSQWFISKVYSAVNLPFGKIDFMDHLA